MQKVSVLKSLVATKLLLIDPIMDPVHGFCFLVMTTYVFGSIELNLKATVNCEWCDGDCDSCPDYYAPYPDDVAHCISSQRYIKADEALRILDICIARGYTIVVCDA